MSKHYHTITDIQKNAQRLAAKYTKPGAKPPPLLPHARSLHVTQTASYLTSFQRRPVHGEPLLLVPLEREQRLGLPVLAVPGVGGRHHRIVDGRQSARQTPHVHAARLGPRGRQRGVLDGGRLHVGGGVVREGVPGVGTGL